MGIRSLFAALAMCFALALTASPASAQATRTWVSGVGDDANPCSRTAPCKTFAGAISKTATGGEINCLDPAGYGSVNITKSMTIDCNYTHGSILAANVNGIIVNATATSSITIRGLSINGAATTTGNGIRIIAARDVNVDDCVIENFGGTGANGNGIRIETAAAIDVNVRNTRIYNTAGTGIIATPTAGIVSLTVNSTQVSRGGDGITINGSTVAMITGSVVSDNTGFGFRTASGTPTVRVGTTVITGNGTGVSVGAGTIESYCTNQLNGNAGDANFFGACLQQK